MGKRNDVFSAMHDLIGTSGSAIQSAYGMSGEWCMMTVWVGFKNAGALDYLCGGAKTAYVPTCWDYYKARGMTGSEPRPGALTFFDYNGNGSPDHIEYCVGDNDDGTFTDISGNSGRDYVFMETVSMYGVLGFAYPDYGIEEEKPIQEEEKMQFIFRPDGENYVAYYDGTKIHVIAHPDEITALNMCYTACFGRSMPQITLGSKNAPYGTRFMQVAQR